MKFTDIDGKEYNFESPGEAVYWAHKELKKVEREIRGLFEKIKRLKEYKERIYKEFGLRKFGGPTRRKIQKVDESEKEVEQVSEQYVKNVEGQTVESQAIEMEQK